MPVDVNVLRIFKMLHLLSTMTGIRTVWSGTVYCGNQPLPDEHRILPSEDNSRYAYQAGCTDVGSYAR